MEIANLVLEYLRVILSWPPLVITALFYFLVSQHASIARLIDRIRGFNFPGGELNIERYETPSENKNGETISSRGKGASASSGEMEPGLAEIDLEFTYFLTSSLEANRLIILRLVDVLWGKFLFSMFNPGVKTFDEKMNLIKDKIDKNAYRDLVSVMNKSSPHPARQDLINVYIKSKLLVDYLRGLATRR